MTSGGGHAFPIQLAKFVTHTAIAFNLHQRRRVVNVKPRFAEREFPQICMRLPNRVRFSYLGGAANSLFLFSFRSHLRPLLDDCDGHRVSWNA